MKRLDIASSVQERMYALYAVNPERLDYNNTFSVIMEGKLDLERFQKALKHCLKYNPMLSARFHQVEGTLCYEVRPELELDIENRQCGLSDYSSFESLKKNELKSFIKPFQLFTDELLMRARLISYGDDKYLLLLDFHHIILDGLSVSVFMNDLQKLYTHPDCKIEKAYTYRDFVEWQNEYVKSEEYEEKQAYWKEILSTETSLCDLLVDDSSKRGEVLASGLYKFELFNYKEIEDFCRCNGISKYSFFIGVFSFTLSKLTFQSDITLGTFVSGRHSLKEQLSSIIGMFVNTVPIRNEVSNGISFIDYLTAVHQNTNSMLQNSDVLYETILDVSANKKNSPLFDVSFNYLQSFNDMLQLDNVSCFVEVEMTLECAQDLTLMLNDRKESFELIFHYAKDLYKKSTIEGVCHLLVETITHVLENEEILLDNIPISSVEDRNKILVEFNDTAVDYPRDKTVIQLFEEQVERTPNKVAVSFGDASITYEELNERANILAHKLRDLGVGPDDYVGIMVERSIEMIVGLYGIIKAGGAYVPIDPSSPEERIRYMFDDSKPKVVLTYRSEIETSIPIIDLGESEVWEGETENLEIVNHPNDLMYLIYTSGTTGNPKGVMIEHQGVVNLVGWQKATGNYGESTTVIQNFNYVFDGSVWEIFPALLSGGSLEVLSEEQRADVTKLVELLPGKRLTLTPSQFKMLIDSSIEHDLLENLSGFEHLYLAGEGLSINLLERYQKISGSKLECIYNAYGPTESTVCASVYEFDQNNNRVLIGKPISNTQVYILSGDALCGIGVPGELCISGDGLARGYLNLPELTIEKFVPNPYGEGRMYRTGDLARWLPDGNIDYMGRIDDQVKIRGFRIELGEIENRLRELEEVKDCAVIAREDALGDKAIYGYVVSDEVLSMSELRESLGKTLPDYMVPSHLMQINVIPLTRNGKLDKRALPEIELRLEREYVAPRNEIEEKLCAIFEDILGVERVGIKDGFFELGGDSIKAIRVMSRLREMNQSISVKDIMQGRKINQIALRVREVSQESSYEQGEVVGVVEKTPIIKAFESWNFAKPHHFNQAMMIPVGDVNSEEIRQTLKELVIHHDMLRAVYRNNTLEILSSEESRLFDFYAFDLREEVEVEGTIESKSTEIQRSMNLEDGPLVKAALFQVKEGNFLMLSIHHLVIDGVSWRILLEDFEELLSQIRSKEEIKLPEKTASFKEWSEALNEYGKGLKKEERDHWDQVQSKLERGKVREEEGLNEGKEKESIVSSSITFSKEITERLEKEGNVAYGTKIDELLLSGLSQAMRELTGQEGLSIMLEGHGREELHKRIEVDRTVGWFTSMYPIVLECHEDTRKSIIQTKEKLRGIPGGGLDYSYVLSEKGIKPDVYFNYLGSFGDEGGIQHSPGESVAKENGLIGGITFNGSISNGVLMFEVSCDGSRFGRNFVEELSHQFKSSVLELVEHCLSREEGEKTASDYGLIDVSVSEFESLTAGYEKEIEKIYSLTPLQEGLLYHYLLDPSSTNYILQSSYSASQEMCEDRVEQALELLSLKYDVLRTVIVYEELKTPKQVVLKERSPEFESIDLRGKDLNQQADEISLLIDTHLKRGFDLQKDTLLRVKYIRLGEGRSKLVWTMHHIVIDGWCTPLIMGSFNQFYEALNRGERYESLKGALLRESKAEYRSFVDWLSRQDVEEGYNYWDNLLDGYEGESEVKGLRGGEESEDESLTERITLGKELTERLQEVALESDVTISTIVETVWGILLQQLNQTEDVVFGKVVSGRGADIAGIESMVGLFINTIPLRMSTSSETTFRELIRGVQEQNNESSVYDYCSLVEIQNRTSQKEELIKTIYVFQNYLTEHEEFNGDREEVLMSLDFAREQTSYPLTMSAHIGVEGLAVELMYLTDSFSSEDVKGLLGKLLNVIEVISHNPDHFVSLLPLATKEEEDLILGEFNDTTVDYPREKTVVELFEEQVEKTPDHIALVFEDEEVTYREFNRRVNILAHKLRGLGVGPDDYVGIMTERSIEMLIGIYGIIKAGGAYVPLDPSYPEERVKYMLDDSKPKVVLTYQCEVETLIPVIDLGEANIWKGNDEDPIRVNKASDLLYCLYTSGTTGRPKGVMIEHQGLINRVLWMQNRYSLNDQDTILQKTTYTFDVSVWEILWWSFVGAKVVMLEPEGEKDPHVISQAIEKHGVTTLHFVPSMLKVFTGWLKEKERAMLLSLKYVFASGEALSTGAVNEFNETVRKQNKKVSLINVYGPTEASIDVTYFDCGDNHDIIPIGRPISNIQLYILNDDALCGIGIPGELRIAGDGLARGYLNLPELTAEKFVDNPYGEGKLYRTGDLARWLPDGNIEYLGRIDDQVKIRGFRIELGEIENAIRELEGVKDCVVITREDSLGEKALYGYVISNNELSMSEIRESLGKTLPDYMVPPYLMQIDSIPVTKNGKLDRRSLPEIELKSGVAYIAPRNEKEEILCSVFGEILGIKTEIGINDNFFILGGDSIKALRIVSKLRERGYQTDIRSIMRDKTPSGIGDRIDQVKEFSIDQEEVLGEVKLTPIQKDFLLTDDREKHHFNQSMMLEKEDGIEEEVLRKVMNEIVRHHDMLRAVYQGESQEIKAYKNDEHFELHVYDYREISNEQELTREIEKASDKIQRSINLERGPLLKVGLYHGEARDYLFMCIHHLVIDGVSWRILLEDLKENYELIEKGEKAFFPLKTSSFQSWSEALERYRGSTGLGKELSYWKAVEGKVEAGNIAFNEEQSGTGIGKINLSLTEERTSQLLYETSGAYHTEINDILLTGVARGIGKATGNSVISINMEGHGREDIGEKLLIDRTVGWFTSMYPVVIEEINTGFEADICSVKEMLRRVPNRGMGYGVLKSLGEDVLTDTMPTVTFNYLGEMTTGKEEKGFVSSRASGGADVSESNSFRTAISIDSMIVQGKFVLHLSYNREKYSDELTQRILEEIEKQLDEVLEHCMNVGIPQHTASDFGKLEWSLEEFQRVMKKIEKRGN